MGYYDSLDLDVDLDSIQDGLKYLARVLGLHSSVAIVPSKTNRNGIKASFGPVNLFRGGAFERARHFHHA